MQQQKPGLAAQQGGGAQATATERRRMLKSPSAKELGRHRVQPMAAPAKLGSAEDAAVYQSTTKLARQDTKKAQGAAGGAAEMQGRRVGQGPG